MRENTDFEVERDDFSITGVVNADKYFSHYDERSPIEKNLLNMLHEESLIFDVEHEDILYT